MKRLEITVPLRLLADIGILSERFFRNNESVEVLQSFSVRPRIAGLFVRVRRRGPFKGPDTVRREARSIQDRYHLQRFEVLSADPRRGEYVAWILWRIPPALREALVEGLTGVVPLEIAKASSGEARVALLASETAIPRLRDALDRVWGPYRLRAVRTAPAATWQPLAKLTARQRDLVQLAYRLGYYDTPARAGLDRIAGLVGISRAGLSKQLRVGERKLLDAAFGP